MALSIRVDGLSFSFGQRGENCLQGVSLEVSESELCCLLGPNGAGKTTLIRCILGLLKPHAGSMSVAGQDTAALSARQLARLVAYVPQSITAVFPFTTLEMVLMGRTPHLGMTASPSRADRRICMATLERLGAGHLASRPFSQLSGGERQLTMLARALVQEAPVLVLDEPTAALDYGNEIRIFQLVTSLVAAGSTVLMTTHQPNHALMWADRAVLMSAGSVAASGGPSEVITGDRLSRLYNVPVRVTSLAPPADEQGDQEQQFFCLPEVTPPRRRRGAADQPPRIP
jgi:iron complex transport system ATP-binding protein